LEKAFAQVLKCFPRYSIILGNELVREGCWDMAMNEYYKINWKYNKENPRIMLYHTSGLSISELMVYHILSYDNEFFKLEEVELKILGSNKIVKTSKILIERIIAIEVLTHDKLTRYKDGFVDGNIPVKKAFSFIASRLANEAKDITSSLSIVLTIAYLDKDNNRIKNITFAADIFPEVCENFSNDYKKRFNLKGMQEDRSSVDDKGEYML
jgi:hypothetical protein